MLIEVLFPPDLQLQVDMVEFDPDQTIVVFLSSSRTTVRCPYCRVSATRINSRYRRQPADLSSFGHVVSLSLLVRRFFCERLAPLGTQN